MGAEANATVSPPRPSLPLNPPLGCPFARSRLTPSTPAVEQLLKGLTPSILPRLTDPEGKGTVRVSISTPLPESAVAEYLTALAARVEPRGVKVGSYPRWGKKRNTVTLVGRCVLLSSAWLLVWGLV